MTVVERTASMVPESLKTAGCVTWRLEGCRAGGPEGEDAARVGPAPGEARRPGPANQTASHTATPAADAVRRKRRKGFQLPSLPARRRTCGRTRPTLHQTAPKTGRFGKRRKKNYEGWEAGR